MTSSFKASAIIPAYNEEQHIAGTVQSLAASGLLEEIIVVDDGSTDATAETAAMSGATVVRLPHNRGKAAAVKAGFAASQGDVILTVDADLQSSALAVCALLEPILDGTAEMVVGRLAGGRRRGGFGAVVTLAQWVVSNEGGILTAPLSGQRAIRRRLLQDLAYWGEGFGLEIALTIHCLRNKVEILELDIPAHHRVTGWTRAGFMHRGRQLLDILKTLQRLECRLE